MSKTASPQRSIEEFIRSLKPAQSRELRAIILEREMGLLKAYRTLSEGASGVYALYSEFNSIAATVPK